MRTLTRHELEDEAEFWHIRNFLREVFLLNGRLEHSWHVARIDHWRWHFILTCKFAESFAGVTSLWQSGAGQIVAVLNPVVEGEVRLHIHPQFRTAELEDEILAVAEERLAAGNGDGRPRILLPVDAGDNLRQQVLVRRGYSKLTGISHKWWRDLDRPVPDATAPPGYIIRSMGTVDEHPARSWASWRSFHSDEPDEAYDGDWSWYCNIQSAPLYRRDLDVVAVADSGEIAAFATISYDDCTRSAVCVLVGTAVEHWRRGLGRAVLLEGFRRLQQLGCTRVFATGYDPPASALYRSVMQRFITAETWVKTLERPTDWGTAHSAVLHD